MMTKKDKKNKNLANIITLMRILGVGIIFWVTPYKTNYGLILAAMIYTLVCLTDFLDGWVARKLKIVSEWGKILDPLADKILVLVFLPLLEMQVITSFPVFIILAREFTVMGLRQQGRVSHQMFLHGLIDQIVLVDNRLPQNKETLKELLSKHYLKGVAVKILGK